MIYFRIMSGCAQYNFILNIVRSPRIKYINIIPIHVVEAGKRKSREEPTEFNVCRVVNYADNKKAPLFCTKLNGATITRSHYRHLGSAIVT